MQGLLDLFTTAPDTSLLYQGHYDPFLVGLSILVAFVAGFAALQIAWLGAQHTLTRIRQVWFFLSGLTLGVGIWAMHFVGMIALSLPCTTGFDAQLTLLSALPALAASVVTVVLMERPLSLRHLLTGGLALGAGIGTMHFTGMASMRLEGLVRYNPWLVALSILVAVLVSVLAIWLKHRLTQVRQLDRILTNAIAAGVISLAISAMHYTAMASAYFLREGDVAAPITVFSPASLAYVTLVITASVIFVNLVFSFVYRSGIKISNRSFRLVALLVSLWCFTAWFAINAYFNHQITGIMQAEQENLQLQQERLGQIIEGRFREVRALAKILTLQPDVLNLLRTPPVGSHKLGPIHQTLSEATDTVELIDVIWIARNSGEVIASSNKGSAEKFIGVNVFNEVEFQLDQESDSFGIGRKPDSTQLYYATPIQEKENVIGALVIRLEIAGISRLLSPDQVLITNPKGIVIFSTDPSFLHRPLRQAGVENSSAKPTTAAAPAASQQGAIMIQPWDEARLAPALRLADKASPYLMETRPIVRRFLTLHTLRDLEVLHQKAQSQVWFTLLVMVGGSLFILGLSTILIWLRASSKVGDDLRVAATAFETQGMMLITDPQLVVTRTNQALTDFTGFTESQLLGQNANVIESDRSLHLSINNPWEEAKVDGNWQGEYWVQGADGFARPTWLAIRTVRDQYHRITHLVAVLVDISKLKNAEEQIKELAYYDPLTKLPNRRMLIERLRNALAKTLRSGHRGALMFLDLDNFKMLNDTLGHDKGDLLLCEVSERLKAILRETDTVARLGGDEFVVMLEDLHKDLAIAAQESRHIGEKFLVALNKPYQLAGYSAHSSASIGIALFGEPYDTIDSILKRADLAMYQSKSSGRNTLHFYDPVMQAAVDTRAALEDDLRKAVELNQFELHYQLQVDVDAKITGVEALLRWNHPTRGTVSPQKFIPVAEEIGLILMIGDWVMHVACQQLIAWSHHPETAHLALAINISPRQFHHPNFTHQVQSLLNSTGVDPSLLMFEITEGLMLRDVDDTIRKMEQLRKMGIRFSLDDFGTGYSSLSYLQRLPIHQLKIDRSFLANIFINSSDAAIVRAIIAMARSLSLEVVAEGVETKAQREYMHRLGCSSCQGFYFGQPVPAEKLPFNVNTTGA